MREAYSRNIPKHIQGIFQSIFKEYSLIFLYKYPLPVYFARTIISSVSLHEYREKTNGCSSCSSYSNEDLKALLESDGGVWIVKTKLSTRRIYCSHPYQCWIDRFLLNKLFNFEFKWFEIWIFANDLVWLIWWFHVVEHLLPFVFIYYMSNFDFDNI